MTKNPPKASEWRAQEIEADSAGYIAAQKVERENRAKADSDDLPRFMPKRTPEEIDDEARRVAKADLWRVI